MTAALRGGDDSPSDRRRRPLKSSSRTLCQSTRPGTPNSEYRHRIQRAGLFAVCGSSWQNPPSSLPFRGCSRQRNYRQDCHRTGRLDDSDYSRSWPCAASTSRWATRGTRSSSGCSVGGGRREEAVVTAVFGMLLRIAYLLSMVDRAAGMLLLPACGWVLIATTSTGTYA